jgi:N4-gp56 family major capsid protein
MTVQAYSTQAGRINEVKGEMIAHAIPFEVLALGCKMKPFPKNKGDNVTYRRVLPYGGASTNANTINRWSVNTTAHSVTEGVTPTAEGITYHDVAVPLSQYGCLYSYTDKAAMLYEDDIPADMIQQCGERMGLVREMIRYGALKACTNAYYAGGTTRPTVDEVVTLNLLRHIAKNLLANHAPMKTRILAASPDYDTSAVEAGFIVFCHTDCEPDIRDLQGFVPVAKYAGKSAINENEIGSVERFRFIVSPELAAYADSGASKGSTGLFSTTGSNLDVYPLIVMGEEAAFDIALRGETSLEPYHLPHTQRDKSDPGAQRGYVGCMFWSAVLVANNGWMAVAEVGVTDTTPA